MKQFLIWVKANAESAIALGLAVFISVLGLVDLVPADLIGKAIPLTLGVLAFAMLRERWRQETVNTELHKSIKETLDGLAAVRIAAGIEATEALARARAGTDRWIFKGGTGTHTRVVTLPECLREVRRVRRVFRVRMEILDPTDLELCNRYARLYQGLAEDEHDDARSWTGKGTQIESYATILAGCWYKQEFEHLLDIEIGLSGSLSTFRWDLSATHLIVTQRGPRFPAMIVEKGRSYYDSWDIELRTSFGECRQVRMERALEIPLGSAPKPERVRELFQRVKAPLPADYDDADVAAIVKKALNDTNPFVRGAGDNLTGATARSLAG
jgi:hypothetical protein